MNNPYIRIVLALLVGALLGYSIAVGPAYYKQWQDNRALLEAMATEPAYQVIAAVENYNPRVTVLNVQSTGSRFVTMWILHDTTGITEEEWMDYFVDTLAHLYYAMADVYPDRYGYAVIIAMPISVSTVEGAKTQIKGGLAYFMDISGVNQFLATPTGETLDTLYAQGHFVFQVIYYSNVTLGEILPREPGYIWPWDSSECVPCGS